MKNLTGVIILLSLISVFAISFTLAEEISSVSNGELSTGINDLEIQENFNEISEQTQNFKKVGSAEVFKGNGWMTNEKTGSLISLSLVQQKYTKDKETIINSLASGTLHIENVGNYRLVQRDKTTTSENTVSYLIFPIELNYKIPDRIVPGEKDVSGAIGTLFLNKDREYPGLTLWTGKIELKVDNLQSNYDVRLGSVKNTIKQTIGIYDVDQKEETNKTEEIYPPKENKTEEVNKTEPVEKVNPTKGVNSTKEEVSQIKKVSFLRRLQFWKNWEK